LIDLRHLFPTAGACLQKHKSNGVDGKVGEHVGEPGGVDAVQGFIEPVENHTAHQKPHHHKEEEEGGKPPDHHSHVVKGEGEGTEEVGTAPAEKPLQIGKQESPEEEFLQKGIHKGNIQADVKKIIPGDPCILGQTSCNGGEIKKGADQKIGTQNHAVERHPQGQGNEKPPFLGFQEAFYVQICVPSGKKQGEQSKKDDLDGRLDNITGL